MYNLIEYLPDNIKNELNEIHPPCKTDISFFLQNTKEYHDLFDGMTRYKNYLNSNKISYKDFNYLKNSLKEKTYILKKPIIINGAQYSEITLKKPNKSHLFFNPLGVYLIKYHD